MIVQLRMGDVMSGFNLFAELLYDALEGLHDVINKNMKCTRHCERCGKKVLLAINYKDFEVSFRTNHGEWYNSKKKLCKSCYNEFKKLVVNFGFEFKTKFD